MGLGFVHSSWRNRDHFRYNAEFVIFLRVMKKYLKISLDFTTEKKRNFLQLQGLKILINKQINRIINCMQYRPTYLI